jgi:hypothetical protein
LIEKKPALRESVGSDKRLLIGAILFSMLLHRIKRDSSFHFLSYNVVLFLPLSIACSQERKEEMKSVIQLHREVHAKEKEEENKTVGFHSIFLSCCLCVVQIQRMFEAEREKERAYDAKKAEDRRKAAAYDEENRRVCAFYLF